MTTAPFSSKFEIVPDQNNTAKTLIKVFGIGGMGCNAIRYIYEQQLAGVELIAINSDAQSLESSCAHKKLQLGRGIGAGGDPKVGAQFMADESDTINGLLEGADMIFIVAGTGGGTGGGGAPVLAALATKQEILTVAMVTTPSSYESLDLLADSALADLRQHSHATMVLSNERLFNQYENESMIAAYSKCNAVLYSAVYGMYEIINVGGIKNVDFADVRKVMRDGRIVITTGEGSGVNAAEDALQNALHCPITESAVIAQAHSVLCNLTVDENFSMKQMSSIQKTLSAMLAPNCVSFLGIVHNAEYNNQVRATVILANSDSDANDAESTPLTSARVAVTSSSSMEPDATPVTEDFDMPTLLRRNRNNKGSN